MTYPLTENYLSGITIKGTLVSESILSGYKTVENRTWSIKPGWYVLHTGNGKIDKDVYKNILRNWPKNIPIPNEKLLPKKAIVGLLLFGNSFIINKKNPIYSNWDFGPVINPILNYIRLDKPIHNIKGQLKLWNVSKVISQNDYNMLLSLIH